MRVLRTVGMAGAVLMVLAGIGHAGPVAARGTLETSALAWHRCAGPDWPDNARCATLRVPLDYREPDGPTIGIAVSRVPAADQAHRRGVLLANPGGPGSPGLRSALGFAEVAGPDVRAAFDHYDLIGFDPRGVGASAAVSCGLSREQILQLKAPMPRRFGVSESASAAAAIARDCAAADDSVLRTVSTANTARDMDRLRAALGVRKISYYGNSYGTYLGVVYSTLFGAHTDRVLLDSLVDSERGWYHQNRLTARATEKRFDDFAAWRVRRGDADSATAVRSAYLGLARVLEGAPARAEEFTVDGRMLRRLTYATVGSDTSFPVLAGTLDCLARPDTDPCRGVLADALRTALDGPQVGDERGASAYVAVQCNDSAVPARLDGYRRAVAEDARRYPITGGGFADVPACAFWPYPAGRTVRASDVGPRNLLLLNNTRDRISDFGGALSTRIALGARARFVAVQGWNHNILSNGNACADRYVARWLGAGELPRTDRYCPADATTVSGPARRDHGAARDRWFGVAVADRALFR